MLLTDPTAYARRLTSDSLPNPRPAIAALTAPAASLKVCLLTPAKHSYPIVFQEIDFQEIQLQVPPIGSGAFGVVSQAQWRGVDVAVKQMLAPEIDLEEFRREALTWY